MNRWKSLYRNAVLCTLLLMSGCGAAKYEHRLQETRQFYEYLDTVNAQLATPAWNRPEIGVAFSLPIQFEGASARMVDDAPPQETAETDEEGGDNDDAEPVAEENPLGVALPGLIASWTTTLDLTDGETGTGYLYLLSNRERFLTPALEGGPSPESYLEELETVLENAFRVALDPDEASDETVNQKYRFQTPMPNSPRSKYITSKDYVAIHFAPDSRIQGRQIEGLLYEHKQGEMQAAILFILPDDTTPQFRQCRETSLSTFTLSDQVPRRAQQESAGSGGVSTGRGPDF